MKVLRLSLMLLLMLVIIIPCYGQSETSGNNITVYSGVVYMPQKTTRGPGFKIVEKAPAPRAIKNQKMYEAFVSSIPKRQIGKWGRRRAPMSKDRLLKKPAIDFNRQMLLVVIRSGTIYMSPKITKITLFPASNSMLVKVFHPALGGARFAARPYGVGTYCAVVMPRFDGKIKFTQKWQAEKASPVRKITIKPSVPKQKSFTLRGKVVHKPWSKSIESYLAGGSDYFIFIASKGQTLPKPLVGRTIFLRTSKAVGKAKLKAFAGKIAKIRGIYVNPKGAELQPWSQYPVGPDGKPVARPGSGKGIKVYDISLAN